MSPSLEQVLEAAEKLREKRNAADAVHAAELESIDERLDKIERWLWEHQPHTADSIVEEFVSYRDKRAEIKKQYDIADQRLKDYMNLREVKLIEILNNVGAQSLRTTYGTAYLGEKSRFSCADWPLYWGYIKEHDRFDLLEKRPSQAPLSKMKEDDNELPPGINVFSETTVTVRRS